ncbi:carboxypeptidase regulatory-like domain-containing protein [Uliginosibacterium sp. 31-16]|uniref:carboxypeptidase regulatory-like domain-containing protein n=1 Tax=Uliginosibacterium sp. 31-16 TaxID=3068315 RepID=UPI00273DA0E3|nr:carboxypeptidase regulatory-like domain-containing protein [Uliginosibacterium sp. 31-16]MDP5241122.1 carboxypeptidase regulatory-like domain-containing protein [Uliginosibacterium sp. 31-16]
MLRKPRFGRATCIVLAAVFALLLPFMANGELSASVQKGLAWLTTKVAEAGLLSNADSVANLYQERSEAAQTLRLLASVPDGLSQAVATAQSQDGELDTESLARQLLERDPADAAVPGLLNKLLARQGDDGGFSGAEGYQSDATDSAWAIAALAQHGRATGSEASRARSYLASHVSSAGVDAHTSGGAALTGAAKVSIAAIASIALQTGSDSASLTGVQQLTKFLLSAQGADGGWQVDTLSSAWALLALSPVSTDTTYKATAQAFLEGRQQADGSWNSDPYVTAIALRALSVRPANPVDSAANGQVLGVVVDAKSGQALDGVTVSLQSALAGSAAVSQPSTLAGAFQFEKLSAGGYQLSFSRAGYVSQTLALNVSIGQKYDVGSIKLAPATSTGILNGVVTAQDTGLPLAGVTVSVSGAASQAATTDSSGRFEFSALTPGNISVSASLNGYTSATGTASVVAGQTLVFSPSLYAAGSPVPTTGKFSGQVIDAATNAVLDAVSVDVTGSATVRLATSGGGYFAGELAPGAYTVQYNRSGYSSVSQTFVIAAGSSVSAGVVKLKAVLLKSSVHGRVVSDTGAAIAGAQVEIVGSQPLLFSKSAEDGAYSLADLGGLRFDVRVSASGYVSQMLTLELDQASDVLRDLTLSAQQSGKLQLGALALDKTSVLANADVVGTVVLVNSDNKPIDLSGLVLVQDQNGDVAATGALLDATLSVLGNFTLAAGESRTLYAKWNSAQYTPGPYQFVVRLIEPGSRSRAVPLGVSIAERGSPLTVGKDARVAGSVTVTPPVVRAGLNSQVHLYATLQNVGNTTLVSQDYRVRVADATSAAVVYETTVSGAGMDVSALSKLDFGSWPAAASGNYIVSVSAISADLQGSASGKLYVGDSGSAIFSVTPSLVPTGNQSVRAKIAVTGQDVTTGVISDPLVPLIKAAIQKSVTFNDAAARTWTVNNNGCQGCHIQTQALVGGETNRKLSTYDQLARATILNNTTLNQTEYGTYNEGYSRIYPREMTMLGLWALGAYHDRPFVASSIKKAADWTVSSQEAGGRWYSDRCDLWSCSNEATTGMNLRSLVDSYKLLSTVAPEKVRTYSVTAKPDAVALYQKFGSATCCVATDSAGRTYLTFTSGKVAQINRDGSIGGTWIGLSSPSGVAEFQGSIVVATKTGLYKLLEDGTQVRVNTGTTFGALVVSPDGQYVYSNSSQENRIYRISADWSSEVWVSGGLLSTPGGMAMDASGRLYVTNYSGMGYVLRFNPDKTYSKVLELANGRSISVLHRADGWYVAGDRGIFRFNEDWEGERIWFSGVTGQLSELPGGRFVVVKNSGYMEDIESTQVDVAPSLSKYVVAIDRATTWLMSRDSLASTDTFLLAQHLAGLGEARNFYRATEPARSEAIAAKMTQIANRLRSNVNVDGGWGRYLKQTSDPMATAQVGVALDYTNPSPSDPLVRKAVEWLLATQKAGGSWHSPIAGTDLAATTWVSIWLPVMLDRLGGIDTDLSLSIPATSTATAFNPVPTTSTMQADGSYVHKWSMTGVTSAGRNVEFDLALSNLLPNEQRPAASAAFLSFKNSFTNELVDAPIDIPKITATAKLDLNAATDKSVYGSDSPVLVSASVINGAGAMASASLQFQIFAPDGKLVSDLGVFPTGNIAAGVSGGTNAVWNTGSSLHAPGYSVLVTLFDANGSQVTQITLPFEISASAAQQVSARVTTDRAVYNPRDTVQITDRVSNLIANSVREGLSLKTVVLNPNGQTQWQTTEPVAQLLGGVSKELSYGVGFSSAPAGSYTVTLSVLDAQGASLAAASTRFSVRDTSLDGAGLSGSLSALPKSANAGDQIAFSYTLSNRGNSALSGLPLSVRVIDPLAADASAVVAELAGKADVAIDGNAQGVKSWQSGASLADRTLAAVLIAKIGDKEIILARDTFQLLKPAVKVDLVPSLDAQARVLALVSCPTSTTGGSAGTGLDVDGSSDGKAHADIASCVAARVKALDDYLTVLGVSHKIVTTKEEFATAFHCGIYNTYWVNGGVHKLDTTMAKEVREAVERGDGLIVDGLRNASTAGPQILPEVLGVTFSGKLPHGSTQIQFSSDNTIAAGLMDTAGQDLRVTLSTAKQIASFTVVPGVQDVSPAVTLNAFGQGHALLFAFDLADMMSAQTAAQSDNLRDVVSRSLSTVAPVLTAPHASRPFGARIQLTNSGALLANTSLRLTLPVGFKLEEAYPQTTVAQQVLTDGRTVLSWVLNSAPGDNKDVVLRLRAGTSAGHFDLPLEAVLTPVSSDGVLGAPLPTASYTLGVDVLAAAAISANTVPVVQALVPSVANELAARDRALTQLAQANTALAQASYQAALDGLVLAADEIRSISSVNTDAPRLAISQALESASAPLCKMLGCITGSVSFATREIQLGNNIVMGRTVYNNCPPQIKDIPVTGLLIRERTGATELTLWDNLTIPGYQNNLRQAGWQALGQEGDVMSLDLSAVWMNHYLHFDRQSFQIVVLPPKLAGTLTLPSNPRASDNLNIGWKVVNSGALGKDVPVSLHFTNVTQAKPAGAYDQTLTFNPGQTSSGNYNWFSSGAVGDQIKVDLVATVKGVTQTLSSATMTLKP